MLGYSTPVARGRSLLLCLCIFLALVLVLSAGATPAVSQNTGNETTSSPNQIYDQLGDLTVKSVEYDGSRFEISMRWNGETPEQVSLTELIELDGSGSAGISIQQQRLFPAAETTVSISADSSGGTAAVILSTASSLSRGEAIVIQSGSPTSRDPIPFNIALLSVGASAVVSVLVAISLVVRQKNQDDKGRERLV